MSVVKIKEKMDAYYELYYRDTLCIPDWKKRVTARDDEADVEKKRFMRLANILGISFDRLDNVLVVGAGTGGALVALKQLGVKGIFGVEPNPEAFEICILKADQFGLDKDLLSRHTAETLPYDTGTFDFVYCFTVLEHVQDVPQALGEMCRVLRPGGTLYINTPNYNYPYEGHYKIHAPTCFGKCITSLYCYLIGKKVSFIKSLQFVTPRRIKHVLKRMDCISFYWIHNSRPVAPTLNLSSPGNMLTYFLYKLGIEKNQEICIKKMSCD